jgi:hypothetical protein
MATWPPPNVPPPPDVLVRHVEAFTGHQAADAPGVLHTGWLYGSDSDQQPAARHPEPLPAGPLYPIGHAGRHALFTSDRAAWDEFIVAVLGVQ